MRSITKAIIGLVLGLLVAPARSDIITDGGSGSILVGTTPVIGCVTNGYILYNNAGFVGCQAGAGGGTVTSVAMTVPPFLSVVGSPVTSVGTFAVSLSGTPLPIANGGTATATPALVQGSGITITGSWPNHTIALTTPVAVANGGTGIASGTSGGIPYFASTTTMASSTALTAGLPIIGGGPGVAPISAAKSGSTTTFATTSGALTSGDCVKFDASGNITDAGPCGAVTSVALTVPSFLTVAGSPITSAGTFAVAYSGTPLPIANGGTGTATPALVAGTGIGVTGSFPNQTVALTTPVTVPNGGTGLASGTSGGIPYFSSIVSIASSSALAANLPVIGGGAGVAPSSGTVSGNTTKFVTTTGTLTSGDCTKLDASGNLIDAGAPCGGAAAASKPYLDVTSAAVGMKTSTASAFDNAPFIGTLMSAIAPYVAATGDAGYPVMFPSDNTQSQTYYYFTAPLMLSRSGTFFCGNVPFRGASAISLIFAPGVDGIIWDSGYNTSDGGWSEGNVQGCGIRSLGFGSGNTTNASNQLTSASFQKTYGNVPTPTYAVGDGLIVKDTTYNGLPLATTPGATITNVSGSTLTLSVNANATASVVTYQLPAAKAYSVTTSSGSNSVTTTSGPAWKIQSGDLIWSDAFTFGCTVWSATGAAGAQTLLIVDARANNTACNASVTHTGGLGKLWIVPAGMKRNNVSHSQFNYVYGWPVGMFMPCAAGMTPAINCTSSFDEGNVYENNLVGRWTSGNNTGASTSIAENFAHNYRYDIMEGGSVGSTYIGNTLNSFENSNAPSPLVGLCGTQNYSIFIGTYASSTGNSVSYCLTATDLYNGAIGSGTLYGATPTFLGSIFGAPNDTSSMISGTFYGPWNFSGNTGANPNSGQSTCMTLAGGDPSKNGGVNFGFSYNCLLSQRHALAWNNTNARWELTYSNFWPSEAYFGAGLAGAGGYVGDNANFFTYHYFLQGIMLSGENAGSNTQFGSERLIDYQTTVSAGTWHKQGDISFNRTPAAGGTMAWADTANGANFLPAAPIANDAAGQDWTIPTVRHNAPTTKTTSYTVTASDYSLIFNCSASCTVTLPAASSVTGREIHMKTIAAFPVVSASSNVAPLTSATLGTAILTGSAGKWATLQSDGTSWIITRGN